MQHTQPFRSCVLLLKCFNYMDAFAECNLLRLPFLKAICFSKQTAGLILIYLSKFLSTPTLSHRRYIKQGYEFLAKLYQAALLSFVFYSCRYTFTSLISWIDPCHFFHPMTVNCQGLRKLKKCKGYASQSHFIGLALQCFTCLCSCVVVLRKALERLPKGR